MNIVHATRSFEAWLASNIEVVRSQLVAKHKAMATDPFMFLRGTFYRWAQLWPEVCSDLAKAPQVLAVADLHVGSFGTWRDKVGRLVWGCDDFDEAYPLSYTNDLVRLATGASIAISEDHLRIKPNVACDAILEGYTASLRAGGQPFVLEEHRKWLRALALSSLDQPSSFWENLDNCAPVRKPVPADASEALKPFLSELSDAYRFVHRIAGDGSLGHPRYVAIGEWHGGQVAFEAKQALPSACVWAANGNHEGSVHIYYQEILEHAVRCPDPYVEMRNKWLVRRLAPDSAPIDLEKLPKKRPEDRLLHAMGWEAANVHLGTKSAIRAVQKDLARRPPDWLRQGAKEMVKATFKDWKEWKKEKS